MVRHWYHASMWPWQHHRYRHPLYEEVERCNWNRECVELWDANTAFFDTLPEEQQLQLIQLKDANNRNVEADEAKDSALDASSVQDEVKHNGLWEKLIGNSKGS